jgi:hypothetical protein
VEIIFLEVGFHCLIVRYFFFMIRGSISSISELVLSFDLVF